MRLPTLLLGILLAPILWAQDAAQTFYIPALAYGPNVWSIVRLKNTSSTRQSVKIEAFREDGISLPLASAYSVEPGASVDVRIDGKSADGEMSWARVELPAGVSARGFVEVLEGNAIEDFPREPHQPSGSERWVIRAAQVQGKQMYFLNTGPQPTTVAFCAAKQAPPNACEKKGIHTARFTVGPNQSLAVQVHKLRGPYFITESSVPGAAVLALFDNGPGTKKVFGAKSSIEFGDPQ